MTTPMITQDAATFVSLGQAMCLAADEGALDRDGADHLVAALVAGILTGCMELDTYARVHETLARLLEQTFHSGSRPAAPAQEPAVGGAAAADDSLGGYLEVVGEAWDKVNGEEESCGRVRHFVATCFDLDRARFGGDTWFEAPLRLPLDEVLQRGRAAGLLIVSIEPGPGGALLASLCDPATAPATAVSGRIVLGWGERRAALLLRPVAR